MNRSDFPVSLIPSESMKKITYKEYNKRELILSSNQNKIIYLISGYAHMIRYDRDEEHTFPYVFCKDEFIGVKNMLADPGYLWEVYTHKEKARVYEIPCDIFEKYILPSPIFLESYLKKVNQMLVQGNKAYYIHFKGGALAYFAFILDYAFSVHPIFTLYRYTDLAYVASISKASLYNFTNKFIEEGIIKKEKNTLTPLDRVKLKKYYE